MYADLLFIFCRLECRIPVCRSRCGLLGETDILLRVVVAFLAHMLGLVILMSDQVRGLRDSRSSLGGAIPVTLVCRRLWWVGSSSRSWPGDNPNHFSSLLAQGGYLYSRHNDQHGQPDNHIVGDLRNSIPYFVGCMLPRERVRAEVLQVRMRILILRGLAGPNLRPSTCIIWSCSIFRIGVHFLSDFCMYLAFLYLYFHFVCLCIESHFAKNRSFFQPLPFWRYYLSRRYTNLLKKKKNA